MLFSWSPLLSPGRSVADALLVWPNRFDCEAQVDEAQKRVLDNRELRTALRSYLHYLATWVESSRQRCLLHVLAFVRNHTVPRRASRNAPHRQLYSCRTLFA